ncbi:MAG: hypothetical protein CO133_01770 [Candidatus Komeilibacteria bacterium CG_4_9_14_3_um_filter_37_5]|nr:MAG: hypothetical protein CO133_01770 [Candidatus Komeilibacteria bacterium CG_4_9_14_3_um_filter_37_5]
MDKFRVPQFIDVESRILGPLTTRQFVIFLVGALFGFICYKLSDFTLFLLEGIIILVFVVLFAFVKVNTAPFHVFLLNYIKTMKSPKVRVWKKEPYTTPAKYEEKQKMSIGSTVPVKRVSSSRLSELSLITDTGGAYEGENELEKNEK